MFRWRFGDFGLVFVQIGGLVVAAIRILGDSGRFVGFGGCCWVPWRERCRSAVGQRWLQF